MLATSVVGYTLASFLAKLLVKRYYYIIIGILLSFVCAATAWAQGSGAVLGRLIDGETQEPVVGAVVEASLADRRYHATTNVKGEFSFPTLPIGNYKGIVTSLGYKSHEFAFAVRGSEVNVGDIAMSVAAVGVETIVVEAIGPRAVIVGDTIHYRAGNFKVAADAEVEVLLGKMPGITIDGGKIEAQGERVTSIYVDNQELFGGNIQQVLQSIPASVVERVEVYNRLSEAAQITGVDDGEGAKVINIVTKGGLSHSDFGKMHAGVGYEPNAKPQITSKWKYTAGGAVNIFRGDRRISILGLFNNMNKQNLSDEGVSVSGSRSNNSRQFSVNRQTGVAEAQMAAVNYSDVWGLRRQVRFDGNVFFNHNDAKNEYTIDRWYNAPSKVDTLHSENFNNPNNYTLRFRGRLDWKVGRRHKLLFIASGSYTNNSSLSRADSVVRWGESAPFDNPYLNPSGGMGGSKTFNWSIYSQYTYRFIKDGRRFLLVTNVNQTTTDNDRCNYSVYSKAPIPDTKWSYTRTFTDQLTTNLRIQPTFQERIGRRTTLNFTYRFQGQWRNRNVRNYVTDSDYKVPDIEDYRVRTSSLYDGSHLYHQAGLGLRYAKKRNWFSVSVMYQYSEIATKNLRTGAESIKPYHLPVYNATLNWAFDRSNSLRISANSQLIAPGLWDLVEAYNLNNTSYISVGNPNLKPVTEHNFFARYTNVSYKHGTTFMIMAKAEHRANYIGTKIVYSPGKLEIDGKSYSPIQFTQRVNLPGHWVYEGRASIGLPIKALRSNLNVAMGVNYSDIPIEIVPSDTKTLIDDTGAFVARGTVEKMHSMTADMQLTLGSNISENVDFTLTWRGAYNHYTSSLDIMNNDYFSHYVNLRVKAVLPLGFTVSTLANFTHYVLFTNKYSDNFTLWNISVGKKVLRNMGEVELCVNDVLNQNRSFSRGAWITYSQVRYNSVLGRTFMARFTYNLRNLSRKIRGDVRGARRARQESFSGVQQKLNELRF